MKKIILAFTITVGLFGASCKKYLDINTNPNSILTAGPNLVLPLAIVNTASLISALNDYGGQTAGYASSAGGYGGFGSSWTYDYPPSQGAGYWASGYSYLEQFQIIINSTQGSTANVYYNAVSKIMKAYIYQNLIDEFNDVPYSNALKGDTLLLPSYDAAKTVYPELAVLLDSAITEINAGLAAASDPATAPTTIASDPLFSGNMMSWKQFANTIKLRLIVRASSVATFANTTYDDGFLTSDAIVNPGYSLSNAASGSQVNPSWNTWVSNYTGARVGQAWIAAQFVTGYYTGEKLTDPVRGGTIYFNYPSVYAYQLGLVGNDPSAPANAGAWYSGGGSGTSLGNAQGVMKGPNMGEPLILLAESDFLQAEAAVRGILPGGVAAAKEDFNKGILASFNYLEELPNLALPTINGALANPAADVATYQAANSTSYLVNFDLATSTAQQIEAIITQKYIAMNFISGQEAWSEYRRTGYPVSSPTVINNPYGSMASIQSQATRPDHLPTRLPYPNTEAATNASNVPTGINVYTSTIFWAK